MLGSGVDKTFLGGAVGSTVATFDDESEIGFGLLPDSRCVLFDGLASLVPRRRRLPPRRPRRVLLRMFSGGSEDTVSPAVVEVFSGRRLTFRSSLLRFRDVLLRSCLRV